MHESNLYMVKKICVVFHSDPESAITSVRIGFPEKEENCGS